MFEDISIFGHAQTMITEQESIILKRLKTAREEAKLSQLELSYRSGVSQNMITYIETGKSSPTLTTLLKLTDALNINPAELFIQPEEERNDIKDEIIKLVKKL